ncbi:MAG: hypothetical protein A2Z14_01275 [Chloroflexi bacterium RBG_16_48_8]|nr:MAG: hypothetical protein A2Z14_01275 [Chloroflexi bacterium RBG_16_48_8]
MRTSGHPRSSLDELQQARERIKYNVSAYCLKFIIGRIDQVNMIDRMDSGRITVFLYDGMMI